MAELEGRIRSACSRLTTEWSDEQFDAVAIAIMHRLHRRRVWMRVGALVGAGLLGLSAWRVVPRRTPAAVVSPRTIVFEGGATGRLEPGSRLERMFDGESAMVRARLLVGGLRLVVPASADRGLSLAVGPAEVLPGPGDVTVERQGRAARVAVREGDVTVRWPGGESVLRGGEEGVFADGDAVGPPPPRADSGWQALARAGRYDEAYRALRQAPPESRRDDDPASLLMASDVARLAGHPGEALAPLRDLLARHESDTRAPLAAFTLGRVLLDDVAQPRAAAEAFALVRALEPGGPLAHDALAREAEAWARAGERARSRAAAREYRWLHASDDETAAPARPGI